MGEIGAGEAANLSPWEEKWHAEVRAARALGFGLIYFKPVSNLFRKINIFNFLTLTFIQIFIF